MRFREYALAPPNAAGLEKMTEPRKIAVVGYAFRLPGLENQTPKGFWVELTSGTNLVSRVEGGRWDQPSFLHPDKANPGTSYTFAAGSIGDVSGFDAPFFGISPREAGQMDPQQRVLLELAWETLENAGIRPSTLRGSRSGVFVGVASTDYAYRRADDLASIDASTMTGNTASIAANRLSYFLDLRGPSMAVNTACSSSLVAFHQACQSIALGESEQAIVGGVSLHLHPLAFIGFSKASMLSPRGLCNVFDAAGDGYVRSEGAGVFLLKDYAKALADGDRIVALVAASGANCDGKTNGLTVPSSEAQAALLVDVYSRAGLSPDDIDYLEAHGTGTAVGDPIETRAIGSALGTRRTRGPLPIGSVKSNVGHLEAASGVAGLVKALLSLEHRLVPPTIHITTPNPNIRFAEWNIEPVTDALPLPNDRRLTIGVNSFGFGGANAHVVLQSADAPQSADTEAGTAPRYLFLSARSADALRAMAGDYAQLLTKHAEWTTYAVAHAAHAGRDLLEHRLVAEAGSRAELIAALTNFSVDGSAPGVDSDKAEPTPGGPVFVYSGNGSQWVGMGQALLAESPRFCELVADVDDCLADLGGQPASALLIGMSAERLASTEVAQPVLFAIQVALTTMFREAGIHPSTVVGHSVGEVAAAWAAGALSLADATRVIHHRSAQQGRTRGAGQMTAASLGTADAEACLAELGLAGRICIAGINSTKGITFAGDPGALSVLEEHLSAQRVFHKRLDLDYAFHSPAMDGIRDGLASALDGLVPVPAAIRFISTVTGGEVDGRQLDADYWWDNIRRPVQFAKAIESLIAEGHQVFVEIGPHPVLRNYIRDALGAAGCEGKVVTPMSRSECSVAHLAAGLRSALSSGIPVNGKTFFPYPAAMVDLPNYPWQRERLWHPVTTESAGLLYRHREHPLLGWRLEPGTPHWENHLDLALLPNYRDHVVGNAVVLPAAAFIEMALAAAALWQPAQRPDVENLEIQTPLLLDEQQARTVRFSIDTADGRFSVRSRLRLSTDPWALHVSGRIAGTIRHDAPPPSMQPVPRVSAPIPGSIHYESARSIGLDYGPAFQTVATVRVAGDTVSANFVTPPAIVGEIGSCLLHPAFLDGCFQLLINLLDHEGGARHAYIPVRMGRVSLFQRGMPVSRAEVTVLRRSPRSLVAACRLFAADGTPVAQVRDARFRRIQLVRAPTDPLQQLAWMAVAKPGIVAALSTTLPVRIARLAARIQTETPFPVVLDTYHRELEPLLDVLCNAWMAECLKRLTGGDAPIDPEYLLETGKLAPERRPLLLEMITLLHQDGILAAQGDTWRWLGDNLLPDGAATWLTLLEDYPDFAARIVATGRLGAKLDVLLAGKGSVASVLPALASPGAFVQLTADTDFHAREIIRRTLLAAGGRVSPERPLRILELTVQGSRLAGDILAGLPPDTCRFVLGTLTGCYSESAEELRETWPAIELCTWSAAGIDSPIDRRFDLVVVTDGLDGFADPSALLANLRERLAIGGELLLLEQSPARWSTLLQLERVPGARFQEPEIWKARFSDAGFGAVAVLEDDPTSHCGATLYISATGPQKHARAAAASGGTWLLVPPPAADCDAATDAALELIREQLSARSVLTVTLPSEDGAADSALDPDAMTAAIIAVDTKYGPISGILFAAALAAEPSAAEASVTQQEALAERATLLLKACEGLGHPCELVLLTRQAVAHLAGGEARPAGAGLWGLGRTMINESAGPRVRLVNLAAPMADAHVAGMLSDELLMPDDEDEIILTDAGRMALRLRTLWAALPQDDAVCLDFAQPGQLGNLRWRAAPVRTPGPGEVAIDVRAAGLNFRDVMYAMGLLSDEAVEEGFAGASLGMELSGVIAAVGPGVEDLAPGMEVMAFAPHAFGSRVITQASAVVAKPGGWTFEAAATVPTAFFTVYYALHHLARLAPGERILIHGAAGGVGIAAIRLAQHLGAEIYATAGSDEKRQFVRQLGVDHVLDSRSLEFADRILELTDGEGVDVVLNSLAGEAIRQNLRILRPFGRFLELGKRDFYDDTRIGLRPFRNNIAYFGIDADQLMSAAPELTGHLFRELMQLFADGALKPLPYRAFPAGEVVEAFRYMQQSKQIGKVVVSFRDGLPLADRTAIPLRGAPTLRLASDATYLISGGLSGFGLTTALRLAERGARHLVLVGRRGPVTDEAKAALAQLADAGVSVRALACDVSRRADVATLFASLADGIPPLRGIVHAAMVIDDGLLRNMTRAGIDRVFAPKMLGALLLDEFSRESELDFFVMYSSATTLFGNPGQGNYVAANHFLESLAARRRQLGLPGLAIGWGAIADVGFLARNDAVKDALQTRMGGSALESATALDVFERLLVAETPAAVGVLELNWPALARFLPSAHSPRFREVAREGSRDSEEEGGAELQRWLRELPPAELRVAVADLLKAEVGEILRLSPEKIDSHKSFYELGLDSLMAVELITAVDQRFGINLPVMAISEGPTIARIADRLILQLTGGDVVADAGETPLAAKVRVLAEQHGGALDNETLARVASGIGEKAG